MRALTGTRPAQAALERLAMTPRPILFLDLDGTLAPLHHRADARPRVPVNTRRILQRLRRSGVQVVVVSGRALPGVVSVLQTQVDAIIGNHGADLRVGRRTRRWLAGNPARLRQAARLLRFEHQSWHRVQVQEKPFSIAVHWRGSASRGARVWWSVRRLLSHSGLEAHTGRHVIDIRIPGINKGTAVTKWLAAREPGAIRAGAVCYVGDDTTDEYAFRALAGRAMTIAVGRRTRGARFRTTSPETLARWLERLLELRESRTPEA
jgi:trehalose 6-phosphate phosphatase